MSDAVNFAEFDRQHVELLAARTVLSMFFSGGGKGGSASNGESGGGLTGGVTDLVQKTSINIPPDLSGGAGGQV